MAAKEQDSWTGARIAHGRANPLRQGKKPPKGVTYSYRGRRQGAVISFRQWGQPAGLLVLALFFAILIPALWPDSADFAAEDELNRVRAAMGSGKGTNETLALLILWFVSFFLAPLCLALAWSTRYRWILDARPDGLRIGLKMPAGPARLVGNLPWDRVKKVEVDLYAVVITVGREGAGESQASGGEEDGDETWEFTLTEAGAKWVARALATAFSGRAAPDTEGVEEDEDGEEHATGVTDELPVGKARHSKISSWGTILANLSLLAGVLFWGWDLPVLLILFFCECYAVYLFSVLRIGLAGGRPLSLGRRSGLALVVALNCVVFTPIVIGGPVGFVCAHAMEHGWSQTEVLPAIVACAERYEASEGAGLLRDPHLLPLLIPLLLLWLNHAKAFVGGFLLGSGQYYANPQSVFLTPILRVYLGAAFLAGGAYLVYLFGQPLYLLACFVLLKTLLDFAADEQERGFLARRVAAARPE